MKQPKIRFNETKWPKLISLVLVAVLIAIFTYSCQKINSASDQRKLERKITTLEQLEVTGTCLEAHVRPELNSDEYQYQGKLTKSYRDKDGVYLLNGSVERKRENVNSESYMRPFLYGSYEPPYSISFKQIDQSAWESADMQLDGVVETSSPGDRRFSARCALKVLNRTVMSN
jgi:hypothetical protein